jgi:hypothetical protein
VQNEVNKCNLNNVNNYYLPINCQSKKQDENDDPKDLSDDRLILQEDGEESVDG